MKKFFAVLIAVVSIAISCNYVLADSFTAVVGMAEECGAKKLR